MAEGAPRAFVTGWPIEHSRSPLIHRHWLERCGIAGSYDPVAVEPSAVAPFFRELAARGYAGGNVTIPHKEAAFAAVARRNGDAEAIGAVNTLWFEDGRLVGGNTDSYGFTANLDERLQGWRDAETALVLGAGGAARAVVHALRQAGLARIAVINRGRERAHLLAASFGPGVTAHGPGEAAALLAGTDLLVNTRPPAEQSADGSEAVALDLAALPDAAMVTDIVYVPLKTPILQAAEARGLKTADGIGMLLHQAVPGFERWFGLRPEVSRELRAKVLADIEAPEHREGGA